MNNKILRKRPLFHCSNEMGKPRKKAIALSAATVVLLNMWTAACSEKEDKTSLSNG